MTQYYTYYINIYKQDICTRQACLIPYLGDLVFGFNKESLLCCLGRDDTESTILIVLSPIKHNKNIILCDLMFGNAMVHSG